MKVVTKEGSRSRGEWLAFFFVLGPERSLPMLIEYGTSMALKPPPLQTLKKWSAKEKWYEQAEAFDARTAAAKAVSVSDTLVELNARHIRLQDLRSVIITQRIERAVEGKAKDDELTLKDALALIDGQIRTDRLIAGAATDRQEIAVAFTNGVAPEIVKIFISVNMIVDPDDRAEAFLRGMNDLANRFVASN